MTVLNSFIDNHDTIISTYQIPVSFAIVMDTETIGEDDWNELQRNLEATIPVYDKINRFATMGQVSKWRRKVRERLPENGLILEVGCGPGSFAEELEGRELICLDPIPEMLRVAEPRVNEMRKKNGYSAAKFVEGKAEELPFEVINRFNF